MDDWLFVDGRELLIFKGLRSCVSCLQFVIRAILILKLDNVFKQLDVGEGISR